jgi:hypothetical protein
MESEQAEIQRVMAVEKSETVARKISASRGHASRVAVKLLARGALPAHIGDEPMWREDNAADTKLIEGRSVREALTAAIAPLAPDGAICGLLPNAMAALILAAHDTEHKCSVERLPSSAVSFDRTLAHVEALGLSFRTQLAGQIARRTMLSLLNHDRTRNPVALAERREYAAASPEEPAHDEPSKDDHAPEQPAASVVEPASHSETEAVRAGRQVKGYARVTVLLSWAEGTPDTPVGAVVEVLRVTDREREDVTRAESQGRPQAVVWWAGKVRMVPKSALQSASRAEAEAWMSEVKS